MLLPLISSSSPDKGNSLPDFLLTWTGFYSSCTSCPISTPTSEAHSLHHDDRGSNVFQNAGILPHHYTVTTRSCCLWPTGQSQEEPETTISGGTCAVHNLSEHCLAVLENIPISHTASSSLTCILCSHASCASKWSWAWTFSTEVVYRWGNISHQW